MRKLFARCLVGLLCAAAPGLVAQSTPPLKLVQTISMPNVAGRLDHMFVDAKNERLFVAGLENGSVEAVDLKAGKWTSTLPGFKKTQGILLVPELNKLFVASGDDGMMRVYSGDQLRLLDSIKLDIGPNRVVYDPSRKLVYVGYGGKDAGKDYGVIGIVDANTDKLVAEVHVDAHPAELLLGSNAEQLFVLIGATNKVQLIDTGSRKITATWPVSSKGPGDGAYDEASHRLLIGTRDPASMIAMDSTNGKEVASLPTVDGMDGVSYDATHKRIYISGGRGFDVGSVYVYQQKSADEYETIGKISTRAGAGTSFWSPELDRFYVAAPAHGSDQAAILVFQPQL